MTAAASLATAETDLARHAAAQQARANHDSDVRTHAAGRPRAPAGERPTAPVAARPSADDVIAASVALRNSTRAEGSIATADQAIVEAEQAEDRVRTASVEAAVEAARVVRLVAACRSAPGDIVAAQIGAMGALDGLMIDIAGEDRGSKPYIRIEYRGLPFDSLCGGEKIIADLLLRRGLRRASRRMALPICVDEAQDYDGGDSPLPAIDGCSIVCITRPQTPQKGT